MRRTRYRQPVAEAAGSAEQSPEQQKNKLLERISHNLKLIDIKRGVIRTNTRRLPFLYVGLVVFGLPLLGAIMLISPILIFVFGALFSAVAGNTFGPVGALERRKSAVAEIERLRAAVGADVYELPDAASPKIFGFLKAAKTELSLTDECLDLRAMNMQAIDEKGVLPFAPYKSLGMIFLNSDGRIDLVHPAIKNQYWLIEARLKGLSDDVIIGALQKYV